LEGASDADLDLRAALRNKGTELLDKVCLLRRMDVNPYEPMPSDEAPPE